jgi:hypothetical protein
MLRLKRAKIQILDRDSSNCSAYQILRLTMKSLRCLTVVVLLTAFASEHVVADGPDDRGFGRGRVLKRLRDDLFGAPKQPTQPRKTPTPIDSKGKEPTPIGKQPANPYAAARYTKPEKPASKVPVAGQRDPRRQAPQVTSPLSNGNPQDFGMMIAANDDDEIQVTRVVPGGNAASAGVRAGDRVLEVGGAALTSIEEFKSISEVMGQGDQLEFKIQSRGSQPRTIKVQFGTPRVIDAENEVLKSGQGANRGENGLRSVLDKSPVQANFRSTNQRAASSPASNDRSDQAPLPPRARGTIDQAKVDTFSDQNLQVPRDGQRWRAQNQQHSISLNGNGPSLNGPGN